MSLRHGLRRFATIAAAAPAPPTQYLVNLARTQGTVKGLTGGTSQQKQRTTLYTVN
jgi:cysteine synthase A